MSARLTPSQRRVVDALRGTPDRHLSDHALAVAAFGAIESRRLTRILSGLVGRGIISGDRSSGWTLRAGDA